MSAGGGGAEERRAQGWPALTEAACGGEGQPGDTLRCCKVVEAEVGYIAVHPGTMRM